MLDGVIFCARHGPKSLAGRVSWSRVLENLEDPRKNGQDFQREILTAINGDRPNDEGGDAFHPPLT